MHGTIWHGCGACEFESSEVVHGTIWHSCGACELESSGVCYIDGLNILASFRLPTCR